MTSITFLGAAQTVTGSKYLLDTGRSKVLIDAGLFQGLKELRERNWQNLPISAVGDRRDRPHARAPRSLRLSAAARVAGIPRPGLLHRRHQGSLQHRPARLGADPGRRRGEREPASVFEARARAAALHRSGRVQGAVRCSSRSATTAPMPVADGIEVEFINAGHLLGSVVRAREDRRPHDPVRRRPRTLRPSGAAGSDDGGGRGLPAGRIHLRQPRARAG